MKIFTDSQKVSPVLGKQDWVGKVVLNYYDNDGSPKTRIIPFFENAIIKETQASRMQKYSPIGRAGNSFAYLGADSREFKVKFNITLPHLYDVLETEETTARGMTKEQRRSLILQRDDMLGGINPSGKIASFFSGVIRAGQKHNKLFGTNGSELTSPTGDGATKYDVHYENTLDDLNRKFYNWAKLKSPMYQINSEGTNRRRSIINKVTNFVTGIRSSVVNNADNPTQGIPIVRLSYGILYDNVPCVCTNYSVDFDPVAGFDTKTMLPRVITIGMSLSETRTHKREANISERQEDGIKGWEVILGASEDSYVTMDPGGPL